MNTETITEQGLTYTVYEDKSNEGSREKLAYAHLGDATQMLSVIEKNNLWWHDNGKEGSSREKWTYGSHYVGRDRNMLALKRGESPKALMDKFIEYRNLLTDSIDVTKYVGMGLSCRRRRKISDDGSEIDISRYVNGDELYWQSYKRDAQRQNVRLGINFGVSCTCGEDDFAKLGACVSLLADILTKLGYGVEIVGMDFVGYNGGRDYTHICLASTFKRPHEPLDIQKLLNTGLPSMLRDFSFGINKRVFEIGTSQGSCTEATPLLKKVANVLYVAEHKNVKNPKKFIDHLDKAIFGICSRKDYVTRSV